MTDHTSLLSLFSSEDNKLFGYAIWRLLESHINYDCAHVGNQPQADDYEPEAPQTINFSFGHESHGIAYQELPADFYPFSVSFPVEANPKGTLTVTTKQPDGCSTTSWLITEVVYSLTLSKLTCLLPHLADKKLSNLMLSMLDVVDTDEYCYSTDSGGRWDV